MYVLLSALVVLLTVGGGARADQPVDAPPQPVPLPELAERAEASQQLMRAAAADARPTPELEDIERRLAGTRPELRALRSRTRSVTRRLQSREAINEVGRAWLAMRDALVRWRRAIAERLTLLEARHAELTHEAAVWHATAEADSAESLPPLALERMQERLGAIDRQIAALEARLAALVDLQARVSEEEREALAMLEGVDQAREDFRGAVLQRDSAPLWESASSGDTWVGADVGSALGAQLMALRTFAWERRGLLLLQLVIFGALVALLRSVRRHAAAWRLDDPRRVAPHVIFDRAVSSAAIVTLLCTPLLHPYAPSAVHAVVTLVALGAMVRLLPGLVGQELRAAVFGVAILVALDQTRVLIDTTVLPARLVLVASLIVAGILLEWVERRGRGRSGQPVAPGAPQRPSVRLIERVFALLLRTAQVAVGVGIAATLLGWVRLGRLLYVDVLFSAYLGLVIFGAVQVLRATVDLVLRSGRAQRLRLVALHGALVRARLSRGLGVAGIALWVTFLLRGLDLDQELLEGARAVLDTELVLGSITLRVGDAVSFVVALLISVWLARLVRFVLEEDVLARVPAGRGVARAIAATVQYALLALGFLVAVAASGVELERFTILAGALGVGLGFGLQNVVNNFVSGLILLFERPILVGDSIEVAGVLGEVRRIGIRSSTVRTWQGAEVIVPNATLISDQVINWTLSDRQRRVEIPVGVAYGTDPRRVIDLLLGVARDHVDVMRQPAPVVLFLGFGASSLDFELRAWTARFETALQTKSELTLGICEALGAAGIEIPFPQRDLHLRSVEPAAARVLGASGASADADATQPREPADRTEGAA